MRTVAVEALPHVLRRMVIGVQLFFRKGVTPEAEGGGAGIFQQIGSGSVWVVTGAAVALPEGGMQMRFPELLLHPGMTIGADILFRTPQKSGVGRRMAPVAVRALTLSDGEMSLLRRLCLHVALAAELVCGEGLSPDMTCGAVSGPNRLMDGSEEERIGGGGVRVMAPQAARRGGNDTVVDFAHGGGGRAVASVAEVGGASPKQGLVVRAMRDMTVIARILCRPVEFSRLHPPAHLLVALETELPRLLQEKVIEGGSMRFVAFPARPHADRFVDRPGLHVLFDPLVAVETQAVSRIPEDETVVGAVGKMAILAVPTEEVEVYHTGFSF